MAIYRSVIILLLQTLQMPLMQVSAPGVTRVTVGHFGEPERLQEESQGGGSVRGGSNHYRFEMQKDPTRGVPCVRHPTKKIISGQESNYLQTRPWDSRAYTYVDFDRAKVGQNSILVRYEEKVISLVGRYEAPGKLPVTSYELIENDIKEMAKSFGDADRFLVRSVMEGIDGPEDSLKVVTHWILEAPQPLLERQPRRRMTEMDLDMNLGTDFESFVLTDWSTYTVFDVFCMFSLLVVTILTGWIMLI